MASSKTYCTLSDMKDIFPNIDEYDNKTPLIGWTAETSRWHKKYFLCCL